MMQPQSTFQFNQVARLPLPGDNVAIATQKLDAGTVIILDGSAAGPGLPRPVTLSHTVLEGHRFAIDSIPAGAALLSWNLPFGMALREIRPGEYVCNAGMLEALHLRRVEFPLPAAPNFAEKYDTYTVDEQTFQPAAQVPRYDHARQLAERTFMGYRRDGQRGVGTRNYIVIMGTTSRSGSFARQLAERTRHLAAGYSHIDGIVAVAHTEGGNEPLHNLDLVLRTLTGFIVHPNVGAILVVDYGGEQVTNETLQRFMLDQGYPLPAVPHHFMTLGRGFQTDLAQGEAVIRDWLEPVDQVPRAPEPLSELKIALQCGGSDAFSGISGNPLAAWVAKEIIRYGGAANLAETDELLGAESYVLQRVRDLATARKFLATVKRFKDRVEWHGATAEGNPSGGNKYRGLYNVTLKSIGAAMKRNPDVRLDYVIDYGERMVEPGYYFMDSPGNDLESIAGQVACGCNLIFFITGNGSITNFPFVPTIKIVTTTRRYELLSKEMDVNAGAYLDGTPMDELGKQMLDLTVAVASGTRSVGEKAGHAQVQLWRNWRQVDGANLEKLLHAPVPNGKSIPIRAEAPASDVLFRAIRTASGVASDQIGLILPTSLCAGQIARMTAERLNQMQLGGEQMSRFVSLVHTEGCGVSGGSAEEIYNRTLLGYLVHPLVKHCLLLEHGCEKTHNDYLRSKIEELGLDTHQYGWASVQMDGGIEKVMDKVESWFAAQLAADPLPQFTTAGLGALRLGLLSAGPISPETARSLAQVTRRIVGAGGTVVLPQNADLLTLDQFRQELLAGQPLQPTLSYAQRLSMPGFHVMETPTGHWVETLTGLGATGVEIILAYTGSRPMQSHPLVPVLQLTAASASGEATIQTADSRDTDLVLGGDPADWANRILQLIGHTASREYRPRLQSQGNTDFQITRGFLGVSL